MNKKNLFVLPLSLLAIACAQPGVEVLGNINIPGCVTATVPPNCTPPHVAPKVTVNLAGPEIGANPLNKCADPGDDIHLQIVPATTAASSVAVIPKNPLHTWLIGTNFPDKGEIIIHVPDPLPTDDYDYIIISSDGRCLDPTFHVN